MGGQLTVGGSVHPLDPLLLRLGVAEARLGSVRPVIEQRAPWPAAAGGTDSSEAEWGPGEVLSHVSEMLQFWLGEMERVIDGQDGPTAFGRLSTDQARALTIARDATLPPRELFERIGSTLERYRRRLVTLSEADLGRTGRHPVRGDFAVPGLIERFVVGHLEEHAEQLERSLGT